MEEGVLNKSHGGGGDDDESDLSDDWNMVMMEGGTVPVSESESIEILNAETEGDETETDNSPPNPSSSSAIPHYITNQPISQGLEEGERRRASERLVCVSSLNQIATADQSDYYSFGSSSYSTAEVVLTVLAVMLLCAATPSYIATLANGVVPPGLFGLPSDTNCHQSTDGELISQVSICRSRNQLLETRMEHIITGIRAVEEKRLTIRELIDQLEEELRKGDTGGEGLVPFSLDKTLSELRVMKSSLQRAEAPGKQKVKRLIGEVKVLEEETRELARMTTGRLDKLREDVKKELSGSRRLSHMTDSVSMKKKGFGEDEIGDGVEEGRKKRDNHEDSQLLDSCKWKGNKLEVGSCSQSDNTRFIDNNNNNNKKPFNKGSVKSKKDKDRKRQKDSSEEDDEEEEEEERELKEERRGKKKNKSSKERSRSDGGDKEEKKKKWSKKDEESWEKRHAKREKAEGKRIGKDGKGKNDDSEGVERLRADILGYVDRLLKDFTKKLNQNRTDDGEDGRNGRWMFHRANARERIRTRGSEPCPPGGLCAPGGYEDPRSPFRSLYTRTRWAVNQWVINIEQCKRHPNHPACTNLT